MRGSSRIADSTRSNASPASNGISTCRRWRLASTALSTRPAISRTRPRCDSAPATTSAIVTMPASVTGHCSRPSSGSSDHSIANSRTARNHARAMRRTKERLLITKTAGTECDWSITSRTARMGPVATKPGMRRRSRDMPGGADEAGATMPGGRATSRGEPAAMQAYLWTKTFHLLFVMAWVAAGFYLPRILVNLAEAGDSGEVRARLVLMGRRLYRFGHVMFGLAVVLGLVLWFGFGVAGGWLHVKLLLVALMFVHYIVAGRWLKGLDRGGTLPTGGKLRWFNEIPVFLLLAVIWLVLAKPF